MSNESQHSSTDEILNEIRRASALPLEEILSEEDKILRKIVAVERRYAYQANPQLESKLKEIAELVSELKTEENQ